MPYVQRDENNNIIGIYANLQDGYAEEFINVHDAQLLPTIEQTRAKMPTLSKWDVRKILTKVGLRAAVEAFIATSTPEDKDAWECATDYERLDPVLAKAALALGISDDQIDQMWALKGTV